jgi:hypothetical protein
MVAFVGRWPLFRGGVSSGLTVVYFASKYSIIIFFGKFVY